MTPINLDEIERRAKAAKEADFFLRHQDRKGLSVIKYIHDKEIYEELMTSDVTLALVARIRELEAEKDELERLRDYALDRLD
jgi:hypothetical protein